MKKIVVVISIFVFISTNIECFSSRTHNKLYLCKNQISNTINILHNSDTVNIPDKQTNDIEGIIGFINENYTSDYEKLNAIYNWITQNISYDLSKLDDNISYENNIEIIEEVLRDKKGVCIHYSTLLDSIAKRLDIESYRVSGYTKQNDTVMNLSHAWNICRIDSTWKVIDATWGAGYIMDDIYHKEINYDFFLIDPSEMIKTHMPYDPLWQLSYYPITNQDFYQGNYDNNRLGKYFNFNDTIEFYKNKSEIEVIKAQLKRIEDNGVVNNMIVEELQYFYSRINYLENVAFADKYNSAVELINKAALHLNEFIDARNQQFKNIDEEELQLLINEAENHSKDAMNQLNSINTNDKQLTTSIKDLKKFISNVQNDIKVQNDFFKKYINTPVTSRMSLFYK